jgi:BASS family bile acid:Na+ symporter
LGAGHLLFSGDSLTLTGLILAAAIPTGITSFVWVTIYKGNTTVTLAIILIDTLMSPFVVPFTLSILVGAKVQMDVDAMMQGLLLMVVLPSILGMLLNQWTRGRIKSWSPHLSPFSKIGLGAVVAINAAVVAPYLRHFDVELLGLAFTVLGLACLGYLLGGAAAKLMRWNHDIVVALIFNSGMRNISAGAVLAAAYFAPPVAIPVVLGMLFQQSLASLFGFLIGKSNLRMEERG